MPRRSVHTHIASYVYVGIYKVLHGPVQCENGQILTLDKASVRMGSSTNKTGQPVGDWVSSQTWFSHVDKV